MSKIVDDGADDDSDCHADMRSVSLLLRLLCCESAPACSMYELLYDDDCVDVHTVSLYVIPTNFCHDLSMKSSSPSCCISSRTRKEEQRVDNPNSHLVVHHHAVLLCEGARWRQ